MDANKILSADFLDIIFDGRNKEYGAYELRKAYNKRLATALVITGSVLLLFFLGSVLASVLGKNNNDKLEVVNDVVLEEIKAPEKKPEVVPPPPPKTPPPPKVEMAKFTPPKIVPDKEVKEDEKPPEVEKVEEAKIGVVNQEGVKDEGVVAPPVEKGTGEVVAPKVDTEDYDKTFTKVEVPAEFPGGLDGWRRYLERNLQYPDAAQENNTSGVVKVQMVVDKDGGISEVQALNDPGDGLADEAVRIIKKGPRWKPAEQNGRKVTYRFVQTVTFQLN